MLQQCSRATSWKRKRIFMKEHYTRSQHTTPVFSELSSQVFWFFIIRYCSPFWHECHHQNFFSCPRKWLPSGRPTTFVYTF
jgi:hypothetical protein